MTAVHTYQLRLRLPQPFELAVVARSHGWFDLPPFAWDAAAGRLGWAVALDSRRAVVVQVAQRGASLVGSLCAEGPLQPQERRHVRQGIVRCLRLDEDLQAFARQAATDRRLAGLVGRGAGRLLRAPTAFEDLIKIVCTTNCSWHATRAMVTQLVSAAGPKGPSGVRAFPPPEVLARKRLRFFTQRVRAGYRARHLLQISRAVASGAVQPERWRNERHPAASVRAELLALPGVGPYAAAGMMRLLGYYADLGLDSWCRAKSARMYGGPASDAAIGRRYLAYGDHAGLAMWLDLTRDWHGDPAAPWP